MLPKKKEKTICGLPVCSPDDFNRNEIKFVRSESEQNQLDFEAAIEIQEFESAVAVEERHDAEAEDSFWDYAL